MSYLNDQLGYRDELLMTRSVVKRDNWVLLEPDGLVKNSIPGYVNCDTTILGSPEMGASFADYIVTVHAGGKNDAIGGDGIETFLYVLEGEVKVENADEEIVLTKGGYFYSPENRPVSFQHSGEGDAKLYLYRRRYEKLEGYAAHTVYGNDADLAWEEYERMTNCYIKDFLPKDFGFDMNMHILKFHIGASHGYIETHVQEHGMYFLSGKGMYRLDDEWVPVKKGDYVFMDSYCPQACYAVGDEGREEELTYIYSKDCNRDVKL